MTEPQDVRTGVIWLIAAAIAAITAACVLIAWNMIESPPAYPVSPQTTLEHDLVEKSRWVDPGTSELQRVEWVDRGARTVRISIDEAIDAVATDPSLIATHRPTEAQR